VTLLRIYNLLLRLYPREYGALFGAEMSAVFAKAARDRGRRGWIATICFFLAEVTGLGLAVAHEWAAKIAYLLSHSTSYIDGRCLPNPLLMRAPGVSWLQHYGWGASDAAAAQGEDDGTAGSLWDGEGTNEQFGNRQAPCMNANQTFALASPIRRLIILIVGFRECRHC